jgi:hypothetical protein
VPNAGDHKGLVFREKSSKRFLKLCHAQMAWFFLL